MPVDAAPLEHEHRPLPATIATALRAQLPSIAERTVAAIVDEVPTYVTAFSAGMGRTIEGAVQLALGGFLELATASTGADAGTPIRPAVDGAYALGRGEARSGRSMDALLAAYRVGARVAWRDLSAVAVAAGLEVAALARFAELVFEFIDRLSASSATGHADELATSGRALQRHLERLATLLATGAPADDLTAAAARAEWPAPRSLTAVVLPQARVRGALLRLDTRTLQVPDAGLVLGPGPVTATGRGDADLTLLLVPDSEGRARAGVLRALHDRTAVVGPARPWQQAAASCERAARAVRLGLTGPAPAPLDTDDVLPELVLRADDAALADLRAQVLEPLAALGADARAKLTETLRAWLLHHGRRERVAAELFVHPQTVRYRMTQLRDLYGARLDDPRTVLAMTVALGVAPACAPTRGPGPALRRPRGAG